MEKIMQLGLGFWASKTLLSAVELGVFTELAKGPADAESLRAAIGIHPRAAVDFLDTLVALGLLERANGHYSNSEEADLFLDRNKPTYVGGMLEMCNQRLYGFWAHLTEALRTGLPQNELKTGDPGLFETLYADPDRLSGFLKAMTGLSRLANVTIASKFPWRDYKTAADIGTAQGDLIVQIAIENPHIHGIGFDLPVVQPIFEEHVRQHGVADRVRFEGGSFWDVPLPKADVIMMGHILHDWDLEQKRLLIQKAYEALPTGGAFIAYDALIDDDRSQNAFGLLMSLNMLIETPGGFDYTGADGCRWLREAGFRETRVERLAGPDSMIVGIK